MKGLTRLSPRSQERDNQERKKNGIRDYIVLGLHEIENMNGPVSYSNSGSRGVKGEWFFLEQ